MRYDACHGDDGEATSISTWIPINPSGASKTNGCIRCIPISSDRYFFHPQEADYMNCSHTSMIPISDELDVSLACRSGNACIWTPSLEHWGTSCQLGASEPRISIGATFRKAGAPRSQFGANPTPLTDLNEDSGPKPIARKDLKHVNLSRRLSYVANAILSYSPWYPGLPGLSLERVEAGACHLDEQSD
jgi:hypothetical protein